MKSGTHEWCIGRSADWNQITNYHFFMTTVSAWTIHPILLGFLAQACLCPFRWETIAASKFCRKNISYMNLTWGRNLEGVAENGCTYVFCRRFSIKLSSQVQGGVGNSWEVKKFVTQRVPKAHFLQTPLIKPNLAAGCLCLLEKPCKTFESRTPEKHLRDFATSNEFGKCLRVKSSAQPQQYSGHWIANRLTLALHEMIPLQTWPSIKL